MLAVAAGDLVHNAIVFHDPLVQLHADQAQARQLGSPVSWADALGRFPQAMSSGHPSGVIFLVALGLNVAGLAITWDRRLAMTLIWFLSLWIPLTLLGGIVDPSQPLFPWGHLARYWFPVLPAITIGGVGACILMVRRIPWRGARLGVALAAGAALAVTYVAPAVAGITHVRRDSSWNQLRAWLSRHPGVRVLWTDSYSAQTLFFYTKTPRGTAAWNGTVEVYTNNVPGRAMHRPMFVTSQSPVPPALIAGWRVLWRSRDGSLKILIKPFPRSQARA